MDILTKIKEYFYEYEKLDQNGIIYSDYLPNESVNYAIHKLPMQEGDILRSYTGGDKLKQFAFAFDIITPYSTANTVRNDKNIQFLIELQDWIENNNRINVLPEIENPQRIEILQSGFLFNVDTDSMNAVYRMTARLVYYQERKF
ncbi:hypothetical protein G7059_01810 [Erysipelothrix sp. HDW6A]|uniref:hypothetical protein n=1 Tax=Erysipelothrix sp. HDW6A TaxID=2714928 RepID=UPI00140BB656|nr:hypothetical protein [Erysipelothrix sp. HDW6A]QIK56669.1 hypothetical protein G7059_01810 [Erysipelothrix sp. HDW6A]